MKEVYLLYGNDLKENRQTLLSVHSNAKAAEARRRQWEKKTSPDFNFYTTRCWRVEE